MGVGTWLAVVKGGERGGERGGEGMGKGEKWRRGVGRRGDVPIEDPPQVIAYHHPSFSCSSHIAQQRQQKPPFAMRCEQKRVPIDQLQSTRVRKNRHAESREESLVEWGEDWILNMYLHPSLPSSSLLGLFTGERGRERERERG